METLRQIQKKMVYPLQLKGSLLCFLLAILATLLVNIPYLTIIGPLILACILGILWKTYIGVPLSCLPGITFTSKKLLRVGIVLLGLKLNVVDLYVRGFSVFLIAFINVTVTLLVVYTLARMLRVKKTLAILTACGTAICGAAAVMAISSQIKANEKDTTIAVSIVCLIGTIFTILYTSFYSNLHLNEVQYGMFAGGTLHEVAHAVAAAVPISSSAVESATIVKLTRVALLIPISFLICIFFKQDSRYDKESIPFPWFIVGFVCMSLINSFITIPSSLLSILIFLAYLLLTMAMSGLGLNLEIRSIKHSGVNALISSFIGSLLLSVLGYVLIVWLNI
ncbi:YeiH family protein [Bacillus weihaiensis]|uniref:YeiH family protein n=1 Tax=Bacillus weihaiensis TaxID=1547283 RepID=UPI002355BA71|nr:YeiH family protein [Bacillus weihaiensis]